MEEAEKAGVELVLTAGIDLPSSDEAVKTAEKIGIVKACVGIHPWRADTFSPEALSKLRELAAHPDVVAVSEIGLDYVGRRTPEWEHTKEYVDPEIQKTALKKQMKLAKELGLPVLVHDRTPGEEVLDILDEEGILEVGAAIHGFSKDPAYARRCTEMGVFLSIGKRSLERENRDLYEVIRQTPLEFLLTETDSGDPTGVIFVAQKIAELKGMAKGDVGRSTTGNLERLLEL
ncbi:MAG: TatD family hydrolase [Candidatus Bathyarchaeota archaeon]|nr:MAG: TatD family hydrolase [Candidatus Bathyarchaeota archaeon]